MYLGDPRDVRRYMSLSQVGLEMVAPIGLGLGLDLWLGWLPWGVIVGAVLGFSVGMIHLYIVVSKDDSDSPKPKDPV
jgi:F0F1-type ATP synthase assembly protein I